MSVGTNRAENVVALLEQLGGEASFRLSGGRLGARLQEAILGELDADAVESLVVREHEIFVSIDCDGHGETVIDCRIECDGSEYVSEVSLSSLSGRPLHELTGRLLRLLEARRPAGPGVSGDVVVRRRAESDRCDIYLASQRLKVTADWLKGTLPCSGFTCDQVGGRKVIRDMFWSRELIDRLCRVKESRPRKEDEAYVAAACCDGDSAWAREIIRSLGRSNALAPRSAKDFFTPPRRAKIISRQFVNDQAARKKGES
jgi:hypothetical protein